MATTSTETNFNTSLDQLEAQLAPPVSALAGNWVNDDPATRGIVRIVLSDSGGALMVHAYGACSPSPCDWGQVKGSTYADNVSSPRAIAFSANYSFGFKTTLLTGHLSGGKLLVENFNAFAAGDTRSDYYGAGSFHRA